MESVKNISTLVGDSRVTITWDAVNECDGYKIDIFNDVDCKKKFRVRYAENNRKTLLGFTNGKKYFFTVTPFIKEDGKEVFGEKSEVASFSTVSRKLKLNKNVLILKKGDVFSLVGEQNNEIVEDLDFRSKDPEIANVTIDGTVSALSKGETCIVVKKRLSDDGSEIYVNVYVDRDEDSNYKSYNDSYERCDDNFNLVSQKAVISLTGDLMCTSTSQMQALEDGRYDFTPSFVNVRKHLKKSDLNIGVLETCLSHTTEYEGEMKRLENGAPNCNSPAAFLDAIKFAGFHGLVTANNHCCDTGIEGLETTINQLMMRNISNIGTSLEKNAHKYSIFNVNGINIAVIAFNCIKNGSETAFYQAGKEYMLSEYSAENALSSIQEVKEKNADFVIVYMHWGQMNSTEVNSSQRRIAQELAEAGADFIVGSHPHVIQQFELIKIHNREIPCIYSLGNFFTSMSELKLNRDSLVLQIAIEKTDCISFSYEFIPTRTLENKDYYYTVFGNDIQFRKNEEVQSSIDRIFASLYPKNRDPKLLTENITIMRLVQEMNGTPNFDIASIADNVIHRKNVTYTNVKLSESIYFAIRINNKENPCFDELNWDYLKQNALMVVTNKEIPGIPCVLVKDVNVAYQSYAKLYRQCFNAKIIAITGSVGKTTTKNLIKSVLSEKYITDGTVASKNIPNAVADNILRINENTEYFILETGSAQPNQVHKSSLAAQPDACVITRIGTAHIDLMGSQQNICDTKLQILDGAAKDAPLFLNYDDPFLRNVRVDDKHDIITYGLDSTDVPYRALNIRVDNDLITFDIICNGKLLRNIKLHMHGKHNVNNALTAFAVGKWANLSDDEIINGIEKYRPEGLRQHVKNINGIDIIFDYISVDTVSSESSFCALKERNVTGRRVVVQGHIMRMGDISPQMHAEVGEQFVKQGLDLALCFDDDTRYMHEKIIELGGNSIYFGNNRYKLIEFLKSYLKPGDVVLFKGLDKYSHFEEVIEPVFYPGLQPSIHAIAGVTMDLSNDNVVFSKNKDARLSPASLTMIMTALLLLEKGKNNLQDIITIEDDEIPYSGSSSANIRIQKGEKYTVEELIKAILVGSAFDATSVLAKLFWETEESVVSEMNIKARELGMHNTHFTNSVGLYDANHYTTAYDLALLCKEALQNPYFKEYVNIKSFEISDSHKTVNNLNRIINEDSPFYYPYALGIKNGNNRRAKYCVASYAQKDGKSLVNIVLGAPDEPRGKKYTKNTPNLRFSYTDSIKMYEYAFGNI